MRTENRREADVIEIGRRVMDRLLSLRMTREEAARTVRFWADRFWQDNIVDLESESYPAVMDDFCEEMLKSMGPLEKGRAYTVTFTIPIRVCVPIDGGMSDDEAEDTAIAMAVETMRGLPQRYLRDEYVSDVEADRRMRFGDVVGDEACFEGTIY